MPLEVALHIAGLVAANPAGIDDLSTADDHIRLLKDVLVRDLPLTVPATATGIAVLTAANAAAVRTTLDIKQRLLQNLTFQSGALASGTTLIPIDDTIPQITEGDQYLTLSITPASASNTLEIDVTAVVSVSAAQSVILALFQDAVASALASEYQYTPTGGAPFVFPLKHVMLAGSTSPITFRVRIGPAAASTLYLNGDAANARFGGTMASRITIKEYAA